MNIYQMFKTDKKAETEAGIEIDYGAFKIRIVRAGGANKRFGELLTKRLKPHRRQIDNDTFDNAIAEKIMAEVYAETVVLGWEGVTDEAGAPLPFTKENCVNLFLEMPDFFRDIQAQAAVAANFKAEERAADAKNSRSSSPGK